LSIEIGTERVDINKIVRNFGGPEGRTYAENPTILRREIEE
jgi:hypothetical protein